MTVLYAGKRAKGADETHKLPAFLASRGWVVAFVLVSLIFVVLTGRDGLFNLYFRWGHEDEYGYGFLAAALVPFFLWKRWHLVRALSNDTKWPGFALVAVAQLGAVLGALGESYYIEQIAFILTLLGIAIAVFGTGTLKVFVPLAVLLLLTIPLPFTVQAIVTVKLQLLSTQIGEAAIRLFGIPVFVEGNVIDLGQYKLQVAEACSGLRYLLPLTCIAFILAYLYEAPFWKKALVVLSAAPITVLVNSFRIAVIAVLVDNFGTHMAEGFLHEFEGWVVFVFGAFLLGVEILALERFRLANVNIASVWGSPTEVQSDVKPISMSGSVVAAALVCTAAFGVVSSVAWAHEFAPKPSRENFAGFPRQLGEWSGKEGQLEPEVLAILNTSDYYVGDFANAPKATPVNFFVAYYDSMSKDSGIHSPRVCLPGNGWEFASFEQKDFAELSPGAQGTFNRVMIQKGEQKLLMYYWFQQRERRSASEFAMKYYLLVDSLTKNRKDGALVRLYTSVAAAGLKGVADADDRLHLFAKDVLPAIGKYIPQ
jgi:exosortase D (VPLPA-CTERM-specific)